MLRFKPRTGGRQIGRIEQGRWLARAYQKGKRGPKPGAKSLSRSDLPLGGTATSASGSARE